MRGIAVLLAVLFATAALAQDKKQQEQARRLQQQVQKLSGEKSVLEREKAQLAREKTDAEKGRDELKKSVDEAKGGLARSRGETAKLRQDLEATRAKLEAETRALAEAKAQLAATAQQLADARADGQRLGTRVANQAASLGSGEKALAACESRNARLAAIGEEVLARYRDKSCGDAFAQAEPFTGIKAVEVENTLQEYRGKIRKESR